MDTGLPAPVCLVRISAVAGGTASRPCNARAKKSQLLQYSDNLLPEALGCPVRPALCLLCLGVGATTDPRLH